MHLWQVSFSSAVALLYLPLYLPFFLILITSSSSACKKFNLASNSPPPSGSSPSSNLLTWWTPRGCMASTFALEFSLLAAAWITCRKLYSSASAFSASVRSLMPAIRLILFKSSDVILFSSVLHRCSWSSTSDRNSMKLLFPCSILSRSMIALSLLTSFRRVLLVSSTISLYV